MDSCCWLSSKAFATCSPCLPNHPRGCGTATPCEGTMTALDNPRLPWTSAATTVGNGAVEHRQRSVVWHRLLVLQPARAEVICTPNAFQEALWHYPCLGTLCCNVQWCQQHPGVFGNHCPCSPRPAISRPHGVLRDPAKPEVHTHPVSSVGGSQVEEHTAR